MAFVEHLPFGWRSLFVLGTFGLLFLPWLSRSLKETRRFTERRDQSTGVDRTPAWQPLQDIVSLYGWRLAALVGVIGPITVILEPGIVFVSKRLQDDLGYSPGEVGLMLALCGIAAPLGNMLFGTVSDRVGRKPVTILASLLLSVAVALFYNATSVVAVAAGLTLLFLSIGGLVVLHTALATELFPTALRSTAAGVREAVGTVGSSAGLWVLSALYAATGSHAASITWVLLLTPISPLVLLFVPETARRELEDIAPDEDSASRLA